MDNINLILVTSVINTPNIPLSYTNTRSVFTREERFIQTKRTIESIKKYLPNHLILLVECTNFTEEELGFFKLECDIILNLWDKRELHPKIFGKSKSLGEGTMTIQALKYIVKNKIKCNHLFKICGRYWLNNDFNYQVYDNEKLVFKKINNNINNIFTSFYKIPSSIINILLEFLQNNEESMANCIGYEVLFAKFLKSLKYRDVDFVSKIGYEGLVTVCGSKYIG